MLSGRNSRVDEAYRGRQVMLMVVCVAIKYTILWIPVHIMLALYVGASAEVTRKFVFFFHFTSTVLALFFIARTVLPYISVAYD